MIAQRRPEPPAVRAIAEALPFCDAAFDAVMAVLSVHHWVDFRAGLAEMRRIAPRRVIFTFDPERQGDFWLVRDYIPAIVGFERDRALANPPVVDPGAVAAALIDDISTTVFVEYARMAPRQAPDVALVLE